MMMLRPIFVSFLIVLLTVKAWRVKTSSFSSFCRRSKSWLQIHHMTTLFATPSEDDVTTVIQSLQNLQSIHSSIDWTALEVFLHAKLPLTYKNWGDTSLWAKELASILGDPSHDEFQVIFERVLQEGNFFGAADYAKLVTTQGVDGIGNVRRPWVVLVSGLSGVRKTTSLYQPWFQDVLFEALGGGKDQSSISIKEQLPTGSHLPNLYPLTLFQNILYHKHPHDISPNTQYYNPPYIISTPGNNSFFRQLDHMLPTIANVEFQRLYSSDSLTPNEYSARKDVIFKRYRTIAEILGILLIRYAQKHGLNVLVETSGRDIASYDYVDTIFASCPEYQKLVLHFTINDIKHAERSVDTRMMEEMKLGRDIVAAQSSSNTATDSTGIGSSVRAHTRAIVSVNAGGPYGSEVLKGVQEDSDKVWMMVSTNKEGLRKDWLKASIAVQGNHDPSKWTVQAKKDIDNGGGPGAATGTTYSFLRK